MSFGTRVLARGTYRIGYAPWSTHELARDRLKAVYSRAGLLVEFVPLPEKRSLVLAAEGEINGDVGRIYGLEKKFPTLVRVDVRLLDLFDAAYVVKGQDVGGYRPELLQSLRVEAVRGVLWAEKAMAGLPLEKVNNYEILFRMLLEGRIDLALAGQPSAEAIFRKDKARYARIRRLDPPVYELPLYHYLNVKNTDIVPKLEKALRELYAEDYWHDGEEN
ncbi:hypothetical protein [Pseudodesulfovibrio methanolicus]|uniref:Solute-binding protein family 3/N-terminal domain-containing protein n=1 Tax=Pseudodesulfovibrio methanolicus TaxID=3126690 RepID=A0ABZ2J1R1_9BACT